ncbi:MAG TPA: hypothetical protein VKT30_02125 [Caulobacteraceae bacterium]|nr:hypothetical protein [Caulobacteraceae bacterium]
MAERNFEVELGRMFAEAPAMGDSDFFALRVDERLRRGWTLRRTLIGGMGLAGGVVGGAQILGGGLVERLGRATTDAGGELTGRVVDFVENSLMPQAFPMNAEIIWFAAAAAAAAIAFAITRVVREF